MIKKIAKGIGFAVLVIVIIFSATVMYTLYKKSRYEETAVPYIKKVVPQISLWDINVMKQYMAPQSIKNTKDEDLSKLLKWLSKLGSLKSIETPQFQNVTSSVTTGEGKNTIVNYTVKAHYEKADAIITIRLLESGQDFKIYYFNLESDGLIQ
jgi:hypothetical protein